MWRVFHESFQHYSAQSPGTGERQIIARIGISKDDAAALMRSGAAFLDSLARISATEQKQISERLSSRLLPPGAVGALPPPVQRRGPTPEEQARAARAVRIDPGAGGTTAAPGIPEILSSDGTAARYEAQRMSALQAHAREVAGLLGVEMYEQLVLWVDAKARDAVQVVPRGIRIPLSDVPHDWLARKIWCHAL